MGRMHVYLSTTIVLLGSGFWTGSRVVSQIVVITKPFVASIEKRFYRSQDDHAPTTLHITYARRSDRSFVRRIEEKTPDGSRSDELVEIYDAAHNQQITLEPFTRSKTTLQYTAKEFSTRIGILESENCAIEDQGSLAEQSPPESRFGRSTRHHVETINIENGSAHLQKWIHERWTVPSLNCFPVKEVDRRSDGATTETDVVSLVEGEPARSLFDVPADYVERSPIAAEREYQRLFPGSTFWGDSSAAHLEKQYKKFGQNPNAL